MRKRALCFLLALTLLFSACVSVRAEVTVKIGVCVGHMSDNDTRAFCDMLKTYFDGLNTNSTRYELFFADAEGSTERQKEYISSLLKQKLKLLVINFLDSSVVDAMADKLEGSGTPVLLFGRQMIVREGNTYTANSSVSDLLDRVKGCYVAGDLRQASLLQGEILTARVNHGDTNRDGVIHYVIIRDNAPRAESRLRTDLSLRAVGNAGLEAVCLSDRSGAADREQAKEIFLQLLQDFGMAIEAVFCTHDEIALGVVQAVQESDGANANISIIGMDGTEEAMQLILERKIAGSVLVDAEAENRTAQQAIQKILKGEPIEKFYWTEYTIVNSRYVRNLNKSE